MLVRQRPGGAAAEGVVLLDAGHVVAQQDEQDADAAAHQHAHKTAAVRQHAINGELAQPADAAHEQHNARQKDPIDAAELLKVLAAGVDLRHHRDQKQNRRWNQRGNQHHVFRAPAIHLAVKAPVHGHGIRQRGIKAQVGNEVHKAHRPQRNQKFFIVHRFLLPWQNPCRKTISSIPETPSGSGSTRCSAPAARR